VEEEDVSNDEMMMIGGDVDDRRCTKSSVRSR